MDTKGLSSTKQMPAVEVTIAVNETHFMIKIADRGNGIAPDQMKKIWHYGHTGHKFNKKQQNSPGIGLPLSRAYANYLGGSIDIKSLHGIGCDTYVKLARIDTIEGFRIWSSLTNTKTTKRPIPFFFCTILLFLFDI